VRRAVEQAASGRCAHGSRTTGIIRRCVGCVAAQERVSTGLVAGKGFNGRPGSGSQQIFAGRRMRVRIRLAVKLTSGAIRLATRIGNGLSDNDSRRKPKRRRRDPLSREDADMPTVRDTAELLDLKRRSDVPSVVHRRNRRVGRRTCVTPCGLIQ